MRLRIALQAVAGIVLVATGVQAAEYTKPNIKAGLWEVSVTPKMSGEMPIPAEQLAKMTPQQRAALEAAVKGAGGKTHTYKECMTPEKIAKGFEMDRGADEKSCKRNIISSTASELTLHDECDDAKRKSSTDVHFEIKSGTQMNGKVHVVVTESGKSMTVDSTLQGKWLGASCGAIKDSELEK